MYLFKRINILTGLSLLLLIFMMFSSELKVNALNDEVMHSPQLNELFLETPLTNMQVETMSFKPTLERINGSGLSLVKFGTNKAANSYAVSVGFPNAHAFKRTYVPEPISRFNIFYSKVNRSVYILDKNNNGVRTDVHYPPRK